MIGAPFTLYWILDPRPLGALDHAVAIIERSDARLGVQVRAKGAGIEEHRRALERLRAPARARGVRLLVNEHVELAGDGVGVHLTESGPLVEEVRERLDTGALIGASCHDAAGLQRRAGADFAVLGPVLEVPNKGAPMGWAQFASLAASAPMPVLALGGIATIEDARRAHAAGAAGIAVSRALAVGGADASDVLLSAWASAGRV